MKNKYGHKYIGTDEIGDMFHSTNVNGSCKYCTLNINYKCKYRNGANTAGPHTFPCSQISRHGYYYDGVEIKIQKFLKTT